MTAFIVVTALAAGFVAGTWRRRDPCPNYHEPRAVRLLEGERWHVCEYARTKHGLMCPRCRRPPPRSIPGDGVPCSR